MVAPLGLQLDDQGRAVLEQLQHLLQQGDLLIGALQAVLLQLLRRQVLHQHVGAGGAPEAGIVDDSQAAVLHQVNIQLCAVAVFNGPAEGGHGVFGDMGLVVIAPVGVTEQPQQAPGAVAPAALQKQGEKLSQDQKGQ